MHDAAIRCLKTCKGSNEAEVAIITAIGLTGSQADYPLLEPYLHSSDVTQAAQSVWQRQYRHAAEASLARLGDEVALADIGQTLEAPVPAQYGDDVATELGAAINNAAFSNNHRFVPLLLRHLDDPGPNRPLGEDYGVPIPAQCAVAALNSLLNRKPSGDVNNDIIYWKQWGQAHPSN